MVASISTYMSKRDWVREMGEKVSMPEVSETQGLRAREYLSHHAYTSIRAE